MESIVFTIALMFACLSLTLAEDEFLNNTVALFESCDPQHKLKCAGYLMSNSTILTAAHCVYGSTCLKAQKESAKFGKDTDKKDVKSVILHPFYVFGSPDYDVAVVKLESEFEGDVTELNLIDSEPKPFEAIKLGGWKLSEDFKFMTYSGSVMDKKMCQNIHSQIVVTNRLICFMHGFQSSVGGYPVFIEKQEGESATKYFLAGIKTKKISSQYPNYLFANVYSSEIRSFINNHLS